LEKTLNFKFILVEIFRNFNRKAKQNLIFGFILKEKQSHFSSHRIEQFIFQKISETPLSFLNINSI
jgi:hypothetical protein